MEREYNGKMIRKQILRAREHSRKDLLEREKTETSEPKLLILPTTQFYKILETHYKNSICY